MPAILGLDQVVDLTPTLELVKSPNTLVASLGVFDTPVHHRTDAITVGRDKAEDGLIVARERGGERNWLTKSTPNMVPVRIPFFPLDHNVKAQDVQSFRTYASSTDLSTDALRTLQEVIDRYTTQILRDVAKTKETILVQAIMGNAYVGTDPDGFSNKNMNYDWYEVFGQTQHVVPVDFTSTTESPASVIESDARAYIIDNKLDGTTATRIVALCSRAFFGKLINNVFVRQAYQYSQQSPNLLRDRLSGDNDVQVFEWNGVTYIEDIHNNIPAGEARLFPMGIPNMFQQHYAPADTPELANTEAQELYTFMISEHRVVKLESEFSLLAVNARPELVVKLVDANP